MESWIFLAVIGAQLAIFASVFFLLWRVSVRVVPDDQRLAIFRGGTFLKLGGPGRTMVLPVVDRAVPLALDDEGTSLVEGRAQFGGADVPVRASAFFETGQRVKIIGFDRDEAAVIVKA